MLNTPVRPPKQHHADGLKNKIRQPEDQVGREFWPRGQGFAEDDEAVIDQHQHEGNGDADVGLAPVHADAEGNADERKAETREGKRDLTVHLGAGLLNHFSHA